MKRKLLLAMLAFTMTSAFSQGAGGVADRVIYKWIEGGLVYYSHILPTGVANYTKLDSRGIEIIDYSDEFNEVETMIVRPKTLENTAVEADKKEEPKVETAEDIKKRNCEIAQNNMRLLNNGDVYDKDSEGNLVPLSGEQVESKRKNVQADLDYFCK